MHSFFYYVICSGARCGAKQQVKRRVLCIENLYHQCVGDTLMMRSLGEAPIVVNAGFSLGEA